MSQMNETASRIFQFAKQPLLEIARLPHWSWRTLVMINLIFSGICGVVAGFIPFNIYNILAGMIFTPFICLMMTLILTLFIFYYFQTFEKRTVSFERIFELTTFANLPFFVFQIGSYLIPPITIIALAFTGLLMVIGLSENFQLTKQRSIRLVGVLYAMIFVVWLWNRIDTMRLEAF